MSPQRAKPPRLASDVAILAGLCLLLFLPFLINGRTILPVDWWGVTPLGSHPSQPHHYTLDPDGSIGNDLAWPAYIAESFRHGTIPLWDPFQSLGDTFLAQGASQVFYPLNWLQALIPIEYWDVLRFLHFFLASWFVYLFARESGFSRWPAIIAGACVYGQGYIQGFLAMSMHLAASTWLPLVLFGVERSFNRSRSVTGFVAICLGTFMLGTGSHQGVVMVCAITVIAWIAARCFIARDFRPAMAMTIPFAAGFLCSAPVWGPFVQNALVVQSEWGRVQEHLELRALPSLFFPFVYGDLYARVFGNPAIDSGRPYAWMPASIWFFAIAGMTGGVLRRNLRMLTLAAIGVWGLFWMMDIPPFNLLRYAPVVQRLTPPYILCSVQLCICIVAGYGVSILPSSGKRELRAIAGAWILVAGGLLFIVARVLLDAWPHAVRWSVVAGIAPNVAWAVAVPVLIYCALWLARRTQIEDAPFGVALAVIAGSAAAFFPSGADDRPVLIVRLALLLAAVVCGVLTLVQRNVQRSVWITIGLLLVVNVALVAKYPGWPKRTDPFVESPYIRFLKSQPQGWRGYGLAGVLFPYFSSRYSIPAINDLSPILPPATVEFFKHYVDDCQNPQFFYGYDQPGCSDRTAMIQFLRRRAVWNYLGVRYVFSGYPDQMRQAAAGEDASLWAFDSVPLVGSVRFPVLVRSAASSVDVFLGTAGRKSRGPLTFDLKNARGDTLVHKQLDSATLPSQNWVTFTQDDGQDIPPNTYTAEIAFRPATAGSTVMLWKDQIRPGNFRYRVQPPDLGMKLVFSTPDDPVKVWENRSAQPLAYVAPENKTAADEPDAQERLVSQEDLHRVAYLEPGTPACVNNASFPHGEEGAVLHTISITPNRVDLTLQAQSPGTLTYVGAYAKGWMARIDNQPADTFRVNGTFVGVCLAASGSHRVTFWYRPPLRNLWLVGAAGGLLLVGFCLIRKVPGVRDTRS